MQVGTRVLIASVPHRDERRKPMAIRFACAACQQPIEIDDEWGGQSVACPYCHKAVTAPTTSTWSPTQIPQAQPSTSALETPTPSSLSPDQTPYRPLTATPTPSTAPVSLGLAIASVLLSLLALVAWAGAVGTQAVDKYGPNPSEEQIHQILENVITHGTMPAPFLTWIALITGAFCALAGIAMAVRSLLRQESHRLMAILACTLCVSFLCCQLALMLVFVGPSAPQTMPA